MRQLILAAAVTGMIGAGATAEAQGYRRSYRPRTYSTSGYAYNGGYSSGSSYNSSTSTGRRGIFGAIMEFERRKNEFLFGR